MVTRKLVRLKLSEFHAGWLESSERCHRRCYGDDGGKRFGRVLACGEQVHTKDYSHTVVEVVFDGRSIPKTWLDPESSGVGRLGFAMLYLPTWVLNWCR